ncbi:Uncharacterised protein [Serratia quinivorans]|nr:Uncharacterised protein [Serratia quinivorans]
MCFPQPQHRAGHSGGLGSHQTEVFNHFTFFVQVHGFGCGFGGDFTVVEEIGFAVDVQRHKAAAANVTGFRVGHGQGKSGGDCRINRVTPGLQNLCGHFGTVLIRCRYGAGIQICGQHRGAKSGECHAEC